jgi:PAS domain-containing protein
LESALNLLTNPIVLRMAMLFCASTAAFGLALVGMRSLRKSLARDAEEIEHTPMTAEGLPIHAYHAVIQQLKQQKHELTTQQQSERRKAKASDALSATILATLSCGVVFVNTNGLVKQANPAARKILGFDSPVGLSVADLFRKATVRPERYKESERHQDQDKQQHGANDAADVERALEPALKASTAVRGLMVNSSGRDGENRVLEVTASPVLGDDARHIGTTLVISDRSEIERVRHDREMQREASSELALGLRTSLTTMMSYAREARERDPELANLAEGIAYEVAQLNHTVGNFLGAGETAQTV